MAKKGAAAALQTDVTNDEDWEKILERKGLVVVDIYSEFGGPCVAMINLLKKIKMEIGGDMLSYATARSDNIESLARFRGLCQPIWMFLRYGKTVNMLFGASGPKLGNTIIRELKRAEMDEPPLFSIPVTEQCDQEIAWKADVDKKRHDKYAEANAARDAAEKEKYEKEMDHYVRSLSNETLVILLPWLFFDEDGNKRDKKSTPAYTELMEKLADCFTVDRETLLQLDENHLKEMQREINFEFTNESKRMMMDGKCLVIRLIVKDKIPETDPETTLLEILYSEPNIPQIPDDLVEDCFVQRNLPPNMDEFMKESMDGEADPDKLEKMLCITTAWTPLNPRNRVVSYRGLFPKYIQDNHGYVDENAKEAVRIFKYDATKANELAKVHQELRSEVMKSAIFERDTLHDPKKLCRTVEEFEELELTRKERNEAVFVWGVKESTIDVFLTFAGIGPIYVSEDIEKGIEDFETWFPRKSAVSQDSQTEEEVKQVLEQHDQQTTEQQPVEQSQEQQQQQTPPAEAA